ncbi:MAG: M48 family metallopeptidase [Chitinophagales bacterium]|nr:M48 family metallopeptidase [Chitinophagales bacterium]
MVIHELAHLIELNHSERFWNIVKVQMSNYFEAKEWLKGNGYFKACQNVILPFCYFGS